ncbi:hypothetical protein TorRG33x02_305260 [Trema orientale]|uniref:Uncharacterized protein n=1 Tax=Trema orientale TaxID=63057 RepID=A0A2P5BXM6_TREOI|nr:hypothetical protein TorRG33x02_305260 [Trema orientale]
MRVTWAFLKDNTTQIQIANEEIGDGDQYEKVSHASLPHEGTDLVVVRYSATRSHGSVVSDSFDGAKRSRWCSCLKGEGIVVDLHVFSAISIYRNTIFVVVL